MFKVMVVEDEPPILRSIANTIEATNTKFKVTARVDSGAEAIRLLEADTPDVVFTDIQMSVIDGLELIKYIREKGLDIIVVILSGYSEFQYARTAMTLGVEDYLLKPLNKADLTILLDKLSDKILKNKKNRNWNYLNSILDSRQTSSYSASSALDSGYYLLLLFCAGSFPTYSLDYYSPRREFWNKIDLESYMPKLLLPEESLWIFDGNTSAEKIAVFTFQNPSKERSDQITSLIFKNLQNQSFPINIVISNFTNKVEEIGNYLKELRILLNKKMIFGISQVISQQYYNDSTEPSKKEVILIDATLEKRIIKHVENSSISHLKNELSNLLKQWESSNFLQVWIQKLLKDIVFICSKSLESSNSFNATELELQINEAISVSNNYPELFKNISYVFEELLNQKINNDDFNESIEQLMKKIDMYICNNLTEPISNQMLSDKFGLVPSYLSKLFREYKGMSPSDYLFFLRVQKAKELIETQPALLTKDIAIFTGFCDPFHFSKVFKRETGLSPSEYRNSIK